MNKPTDRPTSQRPAVFGSIEKVARIERQRMFGPDPVPVEVQVARYQASEEARQMVEEAFEMAEQIRAEAQRSGYETGWAEGYVTGKATAETEARETVERFQAEYRAEIELFVQTMVKETRAIWLDAEPQILAFVLELARKVVKDETALNPDVVIEVVRNALRRVVDSENVRIRVNADDLETVRNARADILMVIDGVRHVEIIEDRRVSQGGCVVESGSGTIDATIETQFRTIEETLHAVREEVLADTQSEGARGKGQGLEADLQAGNA